jgi:hypothetical protein
MFAKGDKKSVRGQKIIGVFKFEDEAETEVDQPPKNEEEKEKPIATVEMTSLFGLLPRPSTVSRPAPPTPKDFQMTSEGLPPGWAMQLMKSGRTLFIDNTNQVLLILLDSSTRATLPMLA